ncbi:MAG: heme peroxidase family protein [Pseudomonadota bacterium]
MLTNISHSGGVEQVGEILFSTPFGYMFTEAANSPECLLPVAERSVDALLALGDAMGDASSPPDAAFDSTIPAAFTYLGQFIDHDITARTDRETGLSRIAQADGRPLPLVPAAPEQVVSNLRNGRRPQLDLDSLYGDGPSFIAGSETEAAALYEPESGKLKVQTLGHGLIDLPRDVRTALIADGRNDENVNVSQLHAAFLAFHNKIVDHLGSGLPPAQQYSKARQIVRWVYQYIVAHDYLPRVCDAEIVNELVRNGPFHFGPGTGGSSLFMPLEFSVAGFRFGHSQIRPSYTLGANSPVNIRDILGVSTAREGAADLLELNNGAWRLKQQNLVHWSNFLQFDGHTAPQMARKIDPQLSAGLFDLPFEGDAGPAAMIRHLAQRNLCRGYLLSIPTGQAVASAMGIVPLTENEVTDGQSDDVKNAIEQGRFQRRTPLWYYVLQEAQAHTSGRSLGAVGSRLVAETLIGFLKHDPNSYLNQAYHSRVYAEGIKVPYRTQPIGTLADMIDYTGLQK